MTEPLFFDNDCLSAFLWVGNESLLVKLYPGRIIIPQRVYDELSNPCVSHLKQRIDALVSSNDATRMSIEVGSKEYTIYRKLTSMPDTGHKIIGDGEAAAIALAKCNDGILASNNLKDIVDYVKYYSLRHLTTGGILKEALDLGFINESQGNVIWNNMLRKRRKLGYATFSCFLSAYY